MKHWATSFKKNTIALYLAARDPRVPMLAKVIIIVMVAYALSPIDLIPDFIPVLGLLDDLILLPIGFWLAVRLIPKPIWQDCQKRAAEQSSTLPRSRRAAVVIIAIWIVVALLVLYWLWGIART